MSFTIMSFKINRTLAVLATITVIIIFTIWHSRDHIGLDLSLENMNPHEWIGDKGRSATKSEAIYQKSLQRRRELMQSAYPDRSLMPYFPAVSHESYHATPWSIWDLFPASYNCPFEMQRIGIMGDGGKWVCGMSRYIANKARPCVIYSFGVQQESSFEQEFLEQTNCEVWGYDNSVATWGPQIKPEYVDSRAHFLKAGIGGVTDTTIDPPTYNIKDLMQQNGHKYIDIIKMDIEGAEWTTISAFLEAFQHQDLPIGQILIEIHIIETWQATPTASAVVDWWEELEARHMRPVWTEPNLLAVTLRIPGNQPSMAEYSLINTKDKRSLLLA